MSDSEGAFIQPDSEAQDFGRTRKSKKGQNDSRDLGFKETPQTVGEVHPEYGVRVKKTLNAKTGRTIQRKGEAIGGIEPLAVPLSVDNRGEATDRDELEERTFRSRYSQLTR